MAEIVPLPTEKRLKSLDEFKSPAWSRASLEGRPAAFGLLLVAMLAAGGIAGLLLPV